MKIELNLTLLYSFITIIICKKVGKNPAPADQIKKLQPTVPRRYDLATDTMVPINPDDLIKKQNDTILTTTTTSIKRRRSINNDNFIIPRDSDESFENDNNDDDDVDGIDGDGDQHKLRFRALRSLLSRMNNLPFIPSPQRRRKTSKSLLCFFTAIPCRSIRDAGIDE